MVMTTKGNNMKQRIGFIGMGHMGSHMAQRLLEAGYQLAIYDRTPERAQEVEQCSLVIFVGGEQETYQQCKSILDVLGKSSFYMGASGMGTTMKLVVNTLLGLGMQALTEAIVLGEKAGIEKRLLLDVLGQTTVLTPGQKSKLENVKREQYPNNFALSLMHKDFHLVLSEAYDLSVAMPATAAAQQMYTAAMAKAMDEDFSVIIKFMEELAGISPHPEQLL